MSGAREQIRFGGWADYREWADHDFRDKLPAEEPGPGTRRQIVVEALTDMVPIKVLVEAESAGIRKSCLVPSSGTSAGEYDDEPPLDLGDLDLGDAALIRPYVGAGDLSVAEDELELETLVESARPYVSLPLKDLTENERLVCRICVVPQSVAEVAVAISAPLGLARTIIREAIDKGYLRMHRTVSLVDGMPSMDLLQRMYSALSRRETR